MCSCPVSLVNIVKYAEVYLARDHAELFGSNGGLSFSQLHSFFSFPDLIHLATDGMDNALSNAQEQTNSSPSNATRGDI